MTRTPETLWATLAGRGPAPSARGRFMPPPRLGAPPIPHVPWGQHPRPSLVGLAKLTRAPDTNPLPPAKSEGLSWGWLTAERIEISAGAARTRQAEDCVRPSSAGDMRSVPSSAGWPSRNGGPSLPAGRQVWRREKFRLSERKLPPGKAPEGFPATL